MSPKPDYPGQLPIMADQDLTPQARQEIAKEISQQKKRKDWKEEPPDKVNKDHSDDEGL